MKNETQFRVAIVILSLSLLYMVFQYFEKDRIYNEYKKITSNQIDSLNTEIFISTNLIGRIDLTLDSLKIVNPKAEKQFQDILNSGHYE